MSVFFFFSSRRRHTRYWRDWSSDVCSSDLDFANGGNIDGLIAAGDTYLKLTDTNSKIVPGHGPVADKAGPLGYYTMLGGAPELMETLIHGGQSRQVVATELAGRAIETKCVEIVHLGND